MTDVYQGSNAQQAVDARNPPVGVPDIPTSPPTMTQRQSRDASPVADTPGAMSPPRSDRALVVVMAVVTGVAVFGLLGVIGYLLVSGRSTAQQPEVTSAQTRSTGAPARGDDSAPSGAGGPATTNVPMDADLSNLTDVQREAAETIRGQIDHFPRSRRSAITFLMGMADKHYSEEDATIAVDSLGIDWVHQARRRAEQIIKSEGLSKRGLINALAHDFPLDEATEAVDGMDVDWSIQAERFALRYADQTAISRVVLHKLMIDPSYGAFEDAEAEQGIDDAGIDFNAEAAQAVEEMLDFDSSYDCDYIKERLTGGPGFTAEEATHGAEAAGAC